MSKAEVLAALESARGHYRSGQALARQLGVSRNAVWKAVASLRADGVPIEAATNRGYRLPAGADILHADAVTALLSPEVAGALQIEVYDRLPGTNAALRARAKLAAAFLNEFWPLYRRGRTSCFLPEYRARQALPGCTVQVCPGRGAPYTATVLAVDNECRLVVRPRGRTETVALSSGEVHILPAAPATSL